MNPQTLFNHALLIMTVSIFSGCATMTSPVVGDSLVLVGTAPGMLMHDKLRENTVEVRSRYAPDSDGTVVYEEGVDYTVDYTVGSIARTENSRIPDFSTNILYGQKNFNHSNFPGFGNTPFFVFVDYMSSNVSSPFVETQQGTLLPKTKATLVAGGTLHIVAFGDSITAGGDATLLELRFQQRYAAYLRDLYPNATITLENGATGGDSTHTGLMRLEEKVLTRNPDLVLIGFGMNDHNVNGVSLETFEANLISIVDQIREKTGAECLMYSTFPPNDDWMHSSHRMELYAAATKRAAFKTNVAYADVYTPWMHILERKDPSSLLGNNINHPNDFGHGLYFEALKSVKF